MVFEICVFNLIKVSRGLLGPQRTLTAHIFVIGWIHLPIIFIILYISYVIIVVKSLGHFGSEKTPRHL